MTTTGSGTDKQASNLRRVTLNLTPRAATALDRTMERTGDNQTDVACRHILEGFFVEDLIARGGKVFLQEPGETEMARMVLLA